MNYLEGEKKKGKHDGLKMCSDNLLPELLKIIQ